MTNLLIPKIVYLIYSSIGSVTTLGGYMNEQHG